MSSKIKSGFYASETKGASESGGLAIRAGDSGPCSVFSGSVLESPLFNRPAGDVSDEKR
jgi:hypothetical protein